MSRWRPALRIARRTVRRNPGRSALIALLVALPVAGATAIDVLVRTMTSPEHRVESRIGSADAAVAGISAERLWTYLPPGSRVAPNPSETSVALDRDGRSKLTTLTTADAGEPLYGHLVRVAEGRAPQGAHEVLVSRSLARRMHLLDGDGHLRDDATITMRRGPAATVTGLARAPFCLDCEQIVAAPTSQFARVAQRREAPTPIFIDALAGAGGRALLLDLPPGVRPERLAATLRARNVPVVTREDIAQQHDSRLVMDDDTLRGAALTAVAVALGLLEIVLLAGTALAVGARRQVRELGLVAATGGSARDVRRIVLAQGLVLGGLGAAAGLLGGVGLALAARPLAERVYNEQLTAWAFGPWELAGAALIGLLSGLAAAIVPAIAAARMQPADALAGRFRARRGQRRRTARMGVAFVVAGVLCGIAGDRLLDDEFRSYVAELAAAARSGVYVQTPSSNPALALVIGGGTLAVIGLVLLAPVLIGLLARLGARLPLSARLAVRDAERQRHRTGPAVGAITVAVAGAVFAAFIVAMQFRADDAQVVPRLPPHVLAIDRDARPASLAGSLASAGDAAASELPGARRHDVRVARTRYAGVHVVAPPRGCSLVGRCGLIEGPLAVAADGAGSTRVLAGGPLDGAARAALRAGEALVFDPVLLDGSGRVHLRGAGRRARTLPGHLVAREQPYLALPRAIVSLATAHERGWTTRVDQLLVTFAASARQADIDSAVALAADGGATAYVDTPAQTPGRTAILVVVALIAGLVTLLGVAISVALSAAEGRADLATLAAVGAPPRRRRALVAVQALFIGGLGGLLGTGLGAFVAYSARATTGSPDFVVPWWNLAAAGLGAPLVAALVAAACARGRLPLVRRVE